MSRQADVCEAADQTAEAQTNGDAGTSGNNDRTFSIAAFSYLLGSIPFGFILVRIFRGQDVRRLAAVTSAPPMLRVHPRRWA